MGRPNLYMLRKVISQLAKAFPGKTDWIHPPGKMAGMTYHHIEAALLPVASNSAWLKQYLWNTLIVTDNGEKWFCGYIGHVHSGLLKRVALLSHLHYLPLALAGTVKCDIQLWYRLLLWQSYWLVGRAGPLESTIELLSIAQLVPMRMLRSGCHWSTSGRWWSVSCPFWQVMGAFTYITIAHIPSCYIRVSITSCSIGYAWASSWLVNSYCNA